VEFELKSQLHLHLRSNTSSVHCISWVHIFRGWGWR